MIENMITEICKNCRWYHDGKCIEYSQCIITEDGRKFYDKIDKEEKEK